MNALQSGAQMSAGVWGGGTRRFNHCKLTKNCVTSHTSPYQKKSDSFHFAINVIMLGMGGKTGKDHTDNISVFSVPVYSGVWLQQSRSMLLKNKHLSGHCGLENVLKGDMSVHRITHH